VGFSGKMYVSRRFGLAVSLAVERKRKIIPCEIKNQPNLVVFAFILVFSRNYPRLIAVTCHACAELKSIAIATIMSPQMKVKKKTSMDR
jgi:hypothetical protein